MVHSEICAVPVELSTVGDRAGTARVVASLRASIGRLVDAEGRPVVERAVRLGALLGGRPGSSARGLGHAPTTGGCW